MLELYTTSGSVCCPFERRLSWQPQDQKSAAYATHEKSLMKLDISVCLCNAAARWYTKITILMRSFFYTVLCIYAPNRAVR